MKEKFKLSLITIVLFLSVSCKKTTTHIDTNNDVTYYARGKFDNVSFNWEVTKKSDSFAAGSAAKSSFYEGVHTGGLSGTISKIIPPSTVRPALEVEFRTMKVSYEDDKFAYLQSFIHTGEWQYDIVNSYVEGSKKVWVKYVDKNGKEYLSAIGNQTESVFKVISTTTLPGQLGIPPSLNIKLSLSCKLYPENGIGNTINLTDGEMVINIFNLF